MIDFNGQSLNATGTYTHTTISLIGCDSVVTFDLTVLPVNRETISDAIFEGSQYDFHGNVINIAGTYVDTLVGTNGCDSIVTLELIVNPIEFTILDEEICADVQYDFHGMLLDTSGVYIDALVSKTGCDSIVTLNLIVHPVYNQTINRQTCEGTPYDFHGQMLNGARTYVDTLQTVNGCDSVITLELEILETLRTDLVSSKCEGEQYDFGGQSVSVSGIYSEP